MIFDKNHIIKSLFNKMLIKTISILYYSKVINFYIFKEII